MQPDRGPRDRPLRAQVVSPVEAPSAVWQLLPAVAGGVEDNEVEVNATVPVCSTQNEARREAGSRVG